MAVVDATSEQDLITIGAAVDGMAFITGGSGIGIGLPNNFHVGGSAADTLPKIEGFSAVISGSCSRATRGQVANFKKSGPAFQIEPLKLAAGLDMAAEALAWALPKLSDGPVLVYSTDEPGEVAAAQEKLGRDAAGEMMEQALARVAEGLVGAGVRKLIVAGGETSGAVVNKLGVQGLRIGPEIDPGVPWTVSLGEREIALALKSGNCGGDNFFEDAFGKLS
jgi:uncharacterized protein YgbK (DUF1537 family)